MPYKANEARRHKIPKARYKVTNWPDRVRQGAPATRQPNTVGDTGGACGVASAQDGPAGPVAHVLGHRHRDRASAAPGLWSAVAADRRAATLTGHPARPEHRRARPHD